jgi:RNA polymerase sigma factor (sigma-70 family)
VVRRLVESWTDDSLFRTLYPGLRRFAAVVRPSEIEGDDLVQEALVRALALQPLADYEDPGAYLRAAIVRIASNHRRSLGRAHRAYARLSPSAEPGAYAEYPSDLDDLRRLKPADRAALYLLAVERRSYGDIAELLGCSETAARSRVSRALKRLRSELVTPSEVLND